MHEFILDRAEYVRQQRTEQYGSSGPVKFDIVAHSMGGLIARWYLRYGRADLQADGGRDYFLEDLLDLILHGLQLGQALLARRQGPLESWMAKSR